MAIGIDGYIEERVERLYVSDEYRVFLLTGQANGTGRRAYISAKPFHTFDPGALSRMKSLAEALDTKSRIAISSNQQSLRFRDECTGTTSEFPLSELDEDVKSRLRYAGDPKTGLLTVWEKYAGPTVSTASDITVGTPIQLKKPVSGKPGKTFNL